MAVVIVGEPGWAITVGYRDDFNDNNTHGWKVGQSSTFPMVEEDNGQGGAGDHSLFMATAGAGGEQPRLLIINDTPTNNGNWEGNWTAAGIRQISMDVRNPNAYTLNMRLGIAGPEGSFAGGGGDTFVTDAIDVAPNPGGWQRIVFSVLASDFNLGAEREDYLDPVPVLAAVSQLRILHNPQVEFIGEFLAGQFYVDNITAIGVVGDYNGNDVVDAADYVVWRDNPDSLINEGASPNAVDVADYTFWQSRFGATDNTGLGAGAGVGLGLTVVPEPATRLFMTGLFVFAWVVVRRRV